MITPSGYRAYNLQDVLWQLNKDSAPASPLGSTGGVTQLVVESDQMGIADSATITTSTPVTTWNNGLWGQIYAS